MSTLSNRICSGILQTPGDLPINIFKHNDLPGQVAWLTKPLAMHFFRNERCVGERLLGNKQQIQDAHAALWPQVAAPPVIRLADTSLSARSLKKQPSALSTSLVFASVLSLFESKNRPMQSRLKGHTFLQKLVNIMCEKTPGGLELNVALVRPNGTYVLRKLYLANPSCGTLFDPAMRRVLVFDWNTEFLSQDKPWIETPVSEPHLADWICFALDSVPVKLRNANRALHSGKSYLRLSALGVLTQLRYVFDQHWIALTSPTKKVLRGTASKRIGTLELWTGVCAAFEALAEGTES